MSHLILEEFVPRNELTDVKKIYIGDDSHRKSEIYKTVTINGTKYDLYETSKNEAILDNALSKKFVRQNANSKKPFLYDDTQIECDENTKGLIWSSNSCWMDSVFVALFANKELYNHYKKIIFENPDFKQSNKLKVDNYRLQEIVTKTVRDLLRKKNVKMSPENRACVNIVGKASNNGAAAYDSLLTNMLSQWGFRLGSTQVEKNVKKPNIFYMDLYKNIGNNKINEIYKFNEKNYKIHSIIAQIAGGLDHVVSCVLCGTDYYIYDGMKSSKIGDRFFKVPIDRYSISLFSKNFWLTKENKVLYSNGKIRYLTAFFVKQ